MKVDGKYRFNLQFPAETEAQIRAGEMLERIGNRKSLIVVEALNAYLAEHPDILGSEAKIVVQTTHSYGRSEIEQMIRDAVREHFTVHQNLQEMVSSPVRDDEMEDDIAQMLDNLDLFQ